MDLLNMIRHICAVTVLMFKFSYSLCSAEKRRVPSDMVDPAVEGSTEQKVSRVTGFERVLLTRRKLMRLPSDLTCLMLSDNPPAVSTSGGDM